MRGHRFAQTFSFGVMEEQRFAQSMDEMGKSSSGDPLVLAERIWAWNAVANCQEDNVVLRLDTLDIIDTLVRSTAGDSGNPTWPAPKVTRGQPLVAAGIRRWPCVGSNVLLTSYGLSSTHCP